MMMSIVEPVLLNIFDAHACFFVIINMRQHVHGSQQTEDSTILCVCVSIEDVTVV
jgi:hypothetical protein